MSGFSFTPLNSVILHMILLMLCTSVNSYTSNQVRLTDWRILSSLQFARKSDIDAQGRVWVATKGGLYFYDTHSGETKSFTNADILPSIDVTAVYCDKASNQVYVGCENGSIVISNSIDQSYTHVLDVTRATQYPRRSITGFLVQANTTYIATEFGFLTFRPEQGVFIETVDRIGSFSENTPVRSIAEFGDSVWVVTDEGSAVAPRNARTLRQPSIWRVLDESSGLPASQVVIFVSTQSALYAAAGSDIYLNRGAGFVKVYSADAPVLGLTVFDDKVVYSTSSAVYVNEQRVTPDTIPGPYTGHNTVFTDGRSIHVLTLENGGIAVRTNDNWKKVLVNSPYSNFFTQFTLDHQRRLWITTEAPPFRGGEGVMMFDGKQWQSFRMETHPTIRSNTYHRIITASDGSVWSSSWGKGVLRFTVHDDQITLENFSETNSLLRGIPTDPAWVVTSEFALDPLGNLWVVNEHSSDRLAVAFNTDGTQRYMVNCLNFQSNGYRVLAVDKNRTLWFGSISGSGILAINDRGTPDVTSDDVCIELRVTNSQLPDNFVTSLRTDNSGSLWIGTTRGAAVISSPWSVLNDRIPFVRRVNILSSTLVVNDIFIDALNLKWISTTTGVFVLNEDGTEVLATFNTSNSPLPDDNVLSSYVDSETGLVYLGTRSGCAVAQSLSLRPSAEYSIAVAPNPFVISRHAEVTLDGLTPDSDVKIVTPSGHFVNGFSVTGRRLVWDGRDSRGNPVDPGVYIIQARSASAGNAGVGKILIKK